MPSGIATEDVTGAAARGTLDTRLIRRLVALNLGLVALQALSAGFLLSGYERAVTVHAVVAAGLQVGALIQMVAALILRRRRKVPRWVVGFSIALFAIVLLQAGFGFRKLYWLHVPLGVGMFGAVMRQAARLDTLERATGARS